MERGGGGSFFVPSVAGSSLGVCVWAKVRDEASRRSAASRTCQFSPRPSRVSPSQEAAHTRLALPVHLIRVVNGTLAVVFYRAGVWVYIFLEGLGHSCEAANTVGARKLGGK